MTLVETLIAMTIILVGFWAFYEVVVRSTDANDYVLAFTSLCSTTQKAVNDVREDLSVAKLLFRNNSTGQGYLAAVSLPADLPLLGQNRLPGAREGGVFEKDTSSTDYTGNVLLFVRTEQSYEGNLRYKTDTSATRGVRIDLYRLVIYYLTKVNGAVIGGVGHSLNLVRAYSPVYADYTQVTSIIDPVTSQQPDLKMQAVADLYTNYNIRYLWDTTAAASSAFYSITPGSGGSYTIANSPDAGHYPPLSAPVEFIHNLRFRHASVSWNTGSSLLSPTSVPAMGFARATGDGFPHGFEVQVIGLSGARQTLVCLTLIRQLPSQRIAAHRAHVVITSKDYF